MCTVEVKIQSCEIKTESEWCVILRRCTSLFPGSANAKGLCECFVRALTYAGVSDWENELGVMAPL